MEEGRCGQVTQSGHKCKNRLVKGCDSCRVHALTQCSVCFSSMLRNTRTLPCGHAFHQKCVDRWKRMCRGSPTCPMCRAPFDLPTYRVTITIQNTRENTTESSQYTTTDIQGIQDEFGLDLRILDPEATMNIVFDLDENEDLREVLAAIGVPRP
jgi:Ring finger domain